MTIRIAFRLASSIVIFATGTLYAANMTTTPEKTEPAVGSPAPAFSNPDHAGNVVSNETIAGHWTVLYFYPKDDTPGCTVQAQTYTTLLPKFEALGVQVYGVSLQDARSHKAFRDKHELTVPLLVDQNSKTARAFEVAVRGEQFASRDTIVIDPEGKIARIDRSVNPEAHPASLLGWLETQIQPE